VGFRSGQLVREGREKGSIYLRARNRETQLFFKKKNPTWLSHVLSMSV
jgi:hypothetical protein